ncbi:glycoside hydrolase family 13 protein [Patellaria atrata CBS 101060]|uniref:Glycoside hydrolase family 13 protein n=1 Tax=Patellaria atrata CBS 101060 TaxID=1346257 RepID=A0A9P4VNU9_9PEZI|nr:glycoside hydrolase family 13 protein [Patellaria atrata CBS 101060]
MVSSPQSIYDPSVRSLLSKESLGTRVFHPSPAAWEDQVLYFLLPDRFSDGNEDGYLDLNSNTTHGNTPVFNPQTDANNAATSDEEKSAWFKAGGRFVGGTLKGVTSKLGYLKRLGITTLWVGPVFKQVPRDAGLYHGYAVQDFLEVEPRFGTSEELKELVETAHREGIYVLLDVILNHCGDVFGYVNGAGPWRGEEYPVQGFRDQQGRPDLEFERVGIADRTGGYRDSAVWPAELQDEDCFTRRGEIRDWDRWPEYLQGDFFSLKDINIGEDNPDGFVPTSALKTLCEVYKYWIALTDLDGFRIDTVKHMGDGPARYFASVIHEFTQSIGKENFFLVGEITGGRAWQTVETTGLNAALGIGNVQRNLWLLPKGYADPPAYFNSFRNALYLNKDSQAWFRNKIVTMIDDHDQVWRSSDKARFCSGENGKELVFAALALNLCTLGIPCIYYGTEQLFDGRGGGDGSDRYIRECMFGGDFGAFRSKGRHFFNENEDVFKETGIIAGIRRVEPALRRGRQYLREISGDGVQFGYPHVIVDRMLSIIAWSRIFAEEEILCAINTNPSQASTAWVTIDDGLHTGESGDVMECLYPRGSSITPIAIEKRNGKAVQLTVPPGGFLLFK